MKKLRSCYHRCIKSFFGYDRLYSYRCSIGVAASQQIINFRSVCSSHVVVMLLLNILSVFECNVCYKFIYICMYVRMYVKLCDSPRSQKNVECPLRCLTNNWRRSSARHIDTDDHVQWSHDTALSQLIAVDWGLLALDSAITSVDSVFTSCSLCCSTALSRLSDSMPALCDGDAMCCSEMPLCDSMSNSDCSLCCSVTLGPDGDSMSFFSCWWTCCTNLPVSHRNIHTHTLTRHELITSQSLQQTTVYTAQRCSGWALDSWSKGRWFDSRPGCYQVN